MTNQAPPAIESVPVVQGDHIAAKLLRAEIVRQLGPRKNLETVEDGDFDVQLFARHRLQHASPPGEVAGWRDIATCPMWQVAFVTDGENVAKAQKAESDYGGHYWAIEPEDALEWEPTHWIDEPTASAPTPAAGVQCVACEDAPKAGNDPCAVCRKTSAQPPVDRFGEAIDQALHEAREVLENERAQLKRDPLDNFTRGQINAAMRIVDRITTLKPAAQGGEA